MTNGFCTNIDAIQITQKREAKNYIEMNDVQSFWIFKALGNRGMLERQQSHRFDHLNQTSLISIYNLPLVFFSELLSTKTQTLKLLKPFSCHLLHWFPISLICSLQKEKVFTNGVVP